MDAGHPVVGDLKYGDGRPDLEWCPRNFLHRYRVGFEGVDGGARFQAVAHLPPDLVEVLSLVVPRSWSSEDVIKAWARSGGSGQTAGDVATSYGPHAWETLTCLRGNRMCD